MKHPDNSNQNNFKDNNFSRWSCYTGVKWSFFLSFCRQSNLDSKRSRCRKEIQWIILFTSSHSPASSIHRIHCLGEQEWPQLVGLCAPCNRAPVRAYRDHICHLHFPPFAPQEKSHSVLTSGVVDRSTRRELGIDRVPKKSAIRCSIIWWL